MNKFLVFAVLAMAIGLLFSCTSDIESAEEVLARAGSSSSVEQGISSGIEEPSSNSVLPSSSSIAPIASSSSVTGDVSSSSAGTGNSSSSSVGSSYAYCIKNGACLEGPFPLRECVDIINGSPSNSCPSPATSSSSSSIAPSSSSVVPSSSSAPPSSSSVALSSSSSVPSSSSVAPSSSSVAPSSSSAPPSSSSVAASSSSSVPSSSSLSGGYSSSYGSVTHGNQTYKTVKIGEQTWMAQNLNYNVSGSKCYGDDPANCNTYGRLYDWSTAMGFASSCNSNSCSVQLKHKGICPSGWHIPSDAEWNALMTAVGGISTAGAKLKATSGWNRVNGTDQYGFSALPGGCDLSSDGHFYDVGDQGYWWSATEHNANGAYYLYMHSNAQVGPATVVRGLTAKYVLYSVRCVQD